MARALRPGDRVRLGRLTPEQWDEYDAAAEWCAKRGVDGRSGDPLPEAVSEAVAREINEDPDAFQERVRETAYALSMRRAGR